MVQIKSKFLFDEENQTSEDMISVSQIQTFLSCSKKWEYGYVEKLTPRIEREYLSIGRLCHKGMQEAMYHLWEMECGCVNIDNLRTGAIQECIEYGVSAMSKMWDEYMRQTAFLAEEIPIIEHTIDDSILIFSQAFREFDPLKYRVLTLWDGRRRFPALELHFVVPCAGSKGLHGYIDAILEDTTTGMMWCTDYKFRKTLAPDEDEAFNIQNAAYSWACYRMGVDVTGTMTWQHLNVPSAEPQILKNGKISRAKIKTTWEKYADFCIKNGQNPEEYEAEMKEKLTDIEWYKKTLEYRNLTTIKRIWNECVVPTSYSIKKAYKSKNRRSLYPWNCKMCQYRSLCQAELRDYDADDIRQREYNIRKPHSDCQ